MTFQRNVNGGSEHEPTIVSFFVFFMTGKTAEGSQTLATDQTSAEGGETSGGSLRSLELSAPFNGHAKVKTRRAPTASPTLARSPDDNGMVTEPLRRANQLNNQATVKWRRKDGHQSIAERTRGAWRSPRGWQTGNQPLHTDRHRKRSPNRYRTITKCLPKSYATVFKRSSQRLPDGDRTAAKRSPRGCNALRTD